MRESTAKLVEALEKEVQTRKMVEILEKAKQDYYHDYVGEAELPQIELVNDLKAASASRRIIKRVVDGDFDGTKEESEEWANSPEGRSVFGEFYRDIHKGKSN